MIITLVIKTVLLTKYREMLTSWFTEVLTLAKDLFNKTEGNSDSELVKMEHFPFSNYAYMSWCGNIIYSDNKYAEIDAESLWHETIHKLLAYRNFSRWYLYYLSYLKYWLEGNYYTIPYEMEAYANQDNPNYIVMKDSYKRYIVKDIKKIYKKNKDNWMEYIKSL